MQQLKNIVLAIVIGCAAVLAHAETPVERANAAKELMRAMNMGNALAGMTNQMDQSMRANYPRIVNGLVAADSTIPANKKEAVAKQAIEQFPKVNAVITKKLTDPEYVADMEKIVISFYADNFTLDEIKEMTKFHQSPLGKKMLEKSPALMPNLLKMISEKWIPRWNDALKQATQQQINSAKK